tara:strand:+ start:43 stop:303 length:261 start_codon:yes stop_codon:yes gene_type:complete
MKIVGMIPARLGSTRVINKNLRLLDKKPLVNHIIDAASKSTLLDEIYLNSEGEIFRGIASGEEMAIRLAVSRYDVDHVNDEDSYNN